jgi:hypothetical protein
MYNDGYYFVCLLLICERPIKDKTQEKIIFQDELSFGRRMKTIKKYKTYQKQVIRMVTSR